MANTVFKITITLAGFLFLTAASNVAYSYIEKRGNIGDETWTTGNTYYISQDLTVQNSKTLTIEAGVVVKCAPGVAIQVNGVLDVNGVDGNMVVFTSMYDDDYGEDLDGPGLPEPIEQDPSPGDWDGIYLNGGSGVGQHGTGYFDYCIVRYGGGGTDGTNIYFYNSDPGSYFSDSISEYSSGSGVWVDDCSPVFRDSTISQNDGDGIYISGSDANPDLGTSEDPGDNYIGDNDGYEINNLSGNIISAYGNDWGTGGIYPPDSVDDPTMVVLSSFTAMTRDGKVILNWRTEVEIDNVGFVIYRNDTKDGDYIRIAFVPGAQDSETSNDYQHTDEQVQPGCTYYYLEDMDLAGKCTKSDVIEVSLIEKETKRHRELRFRSFIVPRRAGPESLPKQNSLLANYPNPFNPETWIPYNLAHAAEVTIRIYNIRGHQIRTLYLGYRPAGFYLSKDKAAHWDGRSNTGEQVGNGVYFYRLSAGGFSFVRKMVILR